MSRMNNTARSLKIISKLNGWDPDQIVGGPRIDEVYHERNQPLDSDTWAIPGVAADPQNNNPGSERATFNTPKPSGNYRGPSANPFPAMPGADE